MFRARRTFGAASLYVPERDSIPEQPCWWCHCYGWRDCVVGGLPAKTSSKSAMGSLSAIIPLLHLCEIYSNLHTIYSFAFLPKLPASKSLIIASGEKPAFPFPSSRLSLTIPSWIVEAICNPSSSLHMRLSCRPRPCRLPPVQASWQNHIGSPFESTIESSSPSAWKMTVCDRLAIWLKLLPMPIWLDLWVISSACFG